MYLYEMGYKVIKISTREIVFLLFMLFSLSVFSEERMSTLLVKDVTIPASIKLPKIEQKIVISKLVSNASADVRSVADFMVRKSNFFIKDDLKGSKFLALNWFTPKGGKDVFFIVTKNNIKYLVILMTLEDGSMQYIQKIAIDSNNIYRTDLSAGRIPNLNIFYKNKKNKYRWGNNIYELI
jgi:hypothetical protein